MTVHDDDVPSARLDALIDALRQPARPDELAGEVEAVAAVADIVASSPKGPTPMPERTRFPRVAAVAVVALLGLGGVSAAAAAVLQARPERTKVDVVPGADSTTSSTTPPTATAQAALTAQAATTAVPRSTVP